MSVVICSICDRPIRAGELYYTGTLDTATAAKLLDTDHPELGN